MLFLSQAIGKLSMKDLRNHNQFRQPMPPYLPSGFSQDGHQVPSLTQLVPGSE
jgi:hypothetical protein